MNRDLLAKTIAIIGSILVVVHLIVFALYRYDIVLFFLGFGALYLIVPLVKKIRQT